MKTIASQRKIVVSADGSGLISQAGGLLLLETLRVTGLGRELSAQLERWRPSRAVHDPGKVIADLALTLALGGDCLADIAMLRAQPEVFGPIASDPTVSRLIDRLAADPVRALKAIRTARAAARQRAWTLAGPHAPGADGEPICLDIDATIVIAHSDKDQAAPIWKKTFGFHPMTVFADHGAGGGGEPLALLLRPGNAGSNTAADHIDATRLALAQLPKQQRRQVLIRTDSGGGTHEFLSWLSRPGRRLSYSIGFALTEQVQTAIQALPAHAWTPAYDADGRVRPGAWVAELTGMVTLEGWPKGMRLIVRKERPHPGAQLRFTDIDGHRFTCFVTNTKRGQLADLELRHRRRARCEDRIRGAKDTGLRNLPLHDFTQNQIWVETVALACELIAWMQMLALDGPARRYEPKRLRLRLFAVAARLARGGRRLRLRLAASWPWAGQLLAAITRLQALPAPT
ncbi:IS1380 family transposase [Microbispora bryophytorum]|uniref:IS1380 family transposase n=1 Tax=Microbispora bryophytorum TaxID=1460882 RepID=A0A8H9LDX1_9ACTN|nr:IS1380 family transposase [Microbispora bryophytorum]MBD3135701.1 IS1380 family transposase [Microbispora bryophytorum]TQS09867.1 IS1380 family transposase [Microbispora bryophytorum]GGN99012.1 IS1380 family transposase [Microbispora bryophytorum]